MIRYAVAEDYLAKDPFMLYKAKRVKKEVLFLSPEQFKKLEKTNLKSKEYNRLKTCLCFVFILDWGLKKWLI